LNVIDARCNHEVYRGEKCLQRGTNWVLKQSALCVKRNVQKAQTMGRCVETE